MKRLLDKTWAKLTSFFLTLLFGTMTVLGGLGVGILVSCDVFLDGGAYMRETMYESQCSSAIHNAYYYLRGTMANAGLLADDTPSTDNSSRCWTICPAPFRKDSPVRTPTAIWRSLTRIPERSPLKTLT